jgi:hypothetical protein
MKELKITPGQRAALKLKIGRKMEQDPEYAKKVQTRLDELAILHNGKFKTGYKYSTG